MYHPQYIYIYYYHYHHSSSPIDTILIHCWHTGDDYDYQFHKAEIMIIIMIISYWLNAIVQSYKPFDAWPRFSTSNGKCVYM